MFETLGNELKDLLALTDTANLSAAQANRLLLSSMAERLDRLVMLIENSSAFEDTEKALVSSQEALNELKSDGLAKEAASTAEALELQLATLVDEVYGMEPAAAGQAVTAMKQAIAAARLELAAIQTLREKLDELAQATKLRIAEFAQKAVAPTYRKSLEQRLQAAIKLGLAPEQITAAISQLTVIGTELTEIALDPQIALSKQKLLLADEHGQARLKKEYEQQLLVVRSKSVPRAERAVKAADGDEGQLTELGRMIKLAEKAAKDGANYERALQVLGQVEARVQQIEQNPQGTGLGDRKALPKHAADFGAGVNALRGKLDTFLQDATAEVTDPAAKDKLGKSLGPLVHRLKMQLNPRVFDTLIERIVDDQVPIADRREARAQALDRLRETRSFVTGHPMMVKLAVNPVAPLEPEQRELDRRLTRLEAHLRSAIRA